MLRDARGRILLARRTAGRDLAGAWEFPGGKLEAGETPFQALDRELHEELGIRVHSAEPLIAVAAGLPGKAHRPRRLPRHPLQRHAARPGEAGAGVVAAEKLSSYPMPPADRPVVAALTQPAQYLITPESFDSSSEFLTGIERALAGGIRRIQLRVAQGRGVDMPELAAQAKRLCDRASAQLLINADIELAARLRCGVHLRAAQLMALEQRPLPTGSAVAASCHDEQELRQAEAIGVDFVVLGPVAMSHTHPDQAPMGWAAVRAATRARQLADLRAGRDERRGPGDGAAAWRTGNCGYSGALAGRL